MLCCSNKTISCFTPQPCITFTLVRFHEAYEACEAEDARLCTEKELKRGDCCGLKCDFDRTEVWLKDKEEGMRDY